jgi:hypothetical protein
MLWLRKYGNFDWENQTPSNMPKSPEQRIMELEAKVKLLEKQKSFFEQQAHVADSKAIIFDMMIDLAENEYQIDIRKNSPPGQSNVCQRTRPNTSVCLSFVRDRQTGLLPQFKAKSRPPVQGCAVVVEMIAETRRAMPRIGARKLYCLLTDKLQALKIGRDKFFGILRANHLLVEAQRSYHVTTDSHHRFRKHKNLILEMPILRPEQVWVSDITYIGKREKPYYLSLVTDAYSKKTMRYYVADNMSTESSVLALKMAIKSRKNDTFKLIHHSDRGV